MIELHLDGKVYAPERLKLRAWLEFEKTQEAIQSAIADHHVEELARLICRVVAIALRASADFATASWIEVVDAYNTLTALNRAREIPLIRPQAQSRQKVPWEYDGREWYWWVHLFAAHYSWKLADIEGLDIDEAVALLQEILVEQQLEREWQWSLSEVAWAYNETTKKSTLQKLERPGWMTDHPIPLPATKVRFRKDMLPVGRIIGEDGSERIVSA